MHMLCERGMLECASAGSVQLHESVPTARSLGAHLIQPPQRHSAEQMMRTQYTLKLVEFIIRHRDVLL